MPEPKIEFDPATGKVIPFAPHPVAPLHDEVSIRNYHRLIHPNWFPVEERMTGLGMDGIAMEDRDG
ncbi:MAG: hypothetical protein V4461_15525 [Pseudomonadota bacterium]